MQISRRTLIGGLAGAGIVAVGGLAYWSTIGSSGDGTGSGGDGGTASWPNARELLKPGPLKEQELGSKDAPVTVIEYASMTCGHCASFHNNVFPTVKSKYIDTGKIHFIFREYPLDPLAAGAFMLARCTGDDNYFAYVGALFHNHRAWTRTNDPVDALFNLSKQAGFTKQSFDKCISNQRLLDQIYAVKDRADQEFGVESTPTFFVNGEFHSGDMSLAEFEQILLRHLGEEASG